MAAGTTGSRNNCTSRRRAVKLVSRPYYELEPGVSGIPCRRGCGWLSMPHSPQASAQASRIQSAAGVVILSPCALVTTMSAIDLLRGQHCAGSSDIVGFLFRSVPAAPNVQPGLGFCMAGPPWRWQLHNQCSASYISTNVNSPPKRTSVLNGVPT
jgi:hypothetical protein